MIVHLRGRLLEKHPTRVVLETGGIGLEVQVPLPTSEALGDVGEDVSLHSVLIVREDALTLYGFRHSRERSLFLKLVSVSGIGPRIALNALSVPSLSDLVTALRNRDLAFLTRLPGIGKKTAERMALELKDALAEFEAEPARTRSAEDAVAALVSLGYTRTAAWKAMSKVEREHGPEANVETLIREALARLGGASAKGS